MTLTVVVGASGSGKTTFLNDVGKRHKCTYIRQYHGIRPYIPIAKIPRFDPTQLPYWDIYVREKTADTILAGGTMAGEFTAGLSGGQRKLLLFELIYQRTQNQSNLLLVLDEPFAGVTDDYVPFIVSRLNLMRTRHNILLVTNDHVTTLKEMADNYLRVSAINRTLVQINDDVDSTNVVDRETAILALSVGEQYQYNSTTWDDLQFFVTVEILTNDSLKAVAAFILIAFGLFTVTFWDSDRLFGAFVMVAASIIAFFCLHPYLLSLVDWRNYMSEEAEALLHSSKVVNKILKTSLTLFLILLVSLVEWATVNLIIDGFESRTFWIAMLMDNVSLTFPFIFLGLYTKLPETRVQIGAAIPFLCLIFFSGTFSPSAGLPGLKILRYLFVRYYMWCMIPTVRGMMEDCPIDDHRMVWYMVLAALVGSFLFLTFVLVRTAYKATTVQHTTDQYNELYKEETFRELQLELYGEQALHLQQQQQRRRLTSNDGGKSLLSVFTGTASDDSNNNNIDLSSTPKQRSTTVSSSSASSHGRSTPMMSQFFTAVAENDVEAATAIENMVTEYA